MTRTAISPRLAISKLEITRLFSVLAGIAAGKPHEFIKAEQE
jgi:hypothetical protein